MRYPLLEPSLQRRIQNYRKSPRSVKQADVMAWLGVRFVSVDEVDESRSLCELAQAGNPNGIVTYQQLPCNEAGVRDPTNSSSVKVKRKEKRRERKMHLASAQLCN
jgi:hypothetical protein